MLRITGRTSFDTVSVEQSLHFLAPMNRTRKRNDRMTEWEIVRGFILRKLIGKLLNTRVHEVIKRHLIGASLFALITTIPSNMTISLLSIEPMSSTDYAYRIVCLYRELDKTIVIFVAMDFRGFVFKCRERFVMMATGHPMPHILHPSQRW